MTQMKHISKSPATCAISGHHKYLCCWWLAVLLALLVVVDIDIFVNCNWVDTWWQ
jgi:hypothetical protein